jgi:hypothetical protein
MIKSALRSLNLVLLKQNVVRFLPGLNRNVDKFVCRMEHCYINQFQQVLIYELKF